MMCTYLLVSFSYSYYYTGLHRSGVRISGEMAKYRNVLESCMLVYYAMIPGTRTLWCIIPPAGRGSVDREYLVTHFLVFLQNRKEDCTLVCTAGRSTYSINFANLVCMVCVWSFDAL